MTPASASKKTKGEDVAIRLGEIPVPRGATHRRKRLGFGESSGHGKPSTKGHKGQRARSGPGLRPGFEGGQMPLIRRIPKRGFHHTRRVEFSIVNLKELSRFPVGSEVGPESLREAGIVRSRTNLIKILGDGGIEHPLKVKAHRFSKSALEKITAAGGTAEKLGRDFSC